MSVKQESENAVLIKIANGKEHKPHKRNIVSIDGQLIHYRFCTGSGRNRFPFNISPTTLTAKYEVWICGNANCYYLIPIEVIGEIYKDEDTYKNKAHGQENLRTMTVHTDTNVVKHGRNGKNKQIAQYLNKTI